jgi:hypothetical protein
VVKIATICTILSIVVSKGLEFMTTLCSEYFSSWILGGRGFYVATLGYEDHAQPNYVYKLDKGLYKV